MRWPVPLMAAALGLLLLAGALLALTQGAMSVPAADSLYLLWDTLSGGSHSTLQTHERVVILELRLPRLLMAVLIGAILAQCGAVMQGLFRNPLADPGIIGVSSGAALGAMLAIVLLPPALSAWGIPLAAFLAGLCTTALVYTLSRSAQGTSVLILLLAGVAIAAFTGAAIGFLSYFADDRSLRELSLWQMGSLAHARPGTLYLAGAVLVLLGMAFYRQARALDALALGEAEARHLGIDVERLKHRLILLTAVGVGVAVACAGIIGFIGLVVPHLIRLTAGPGHRSLLPLSALCGAALLLLSDWAARVLASPAELPVGLITALLGAPFFLALLLQQRRQWA